MPLQTNALLLINKKPSQLKYAFKSEENCKDKLCLPLLLFKTAYTLCNTFRSAQKRNLNIIHWQTGNLSKKGSSYICQKSNSGALLYSTRR